MRGYAKESCTYKVQTARSGSKYRKILKVQTGVMLSTP